MPIRFYQTDAELARLFKTVNGIIFPGGLTDLYLADPYTVAATKLYKMAVASNDAGVPFPIWGTCLGHQLLQIIVTGAHFGDILVETDAVSHPTTLNFTEAAKASRMWGALFEERPTLVDKLSSPAWNISMENHEFGMPVENYGRASKWPALAANFDVLTTTVDRGGVEYVSTIEHKKYPFFGTQWHPEKVRERERWRGERGRGGSEEKPRTPAPKTPDAPPLPPPVPPPSPPLSSPTAPSPSPTPPCRCPTTWPTRSWTRPARARTRPRAWRWSSAT